MTQLAYTRLIKQLLFSRPIDIPVFHEIALRLQQMMSAHSYRIEEAIKLVHEDTALAAEMLRQANNTYNSGKTPITTIKDAIVRLGSQQIVNLAFTASMANSKSDDPVINSHLKQLWHHSHAVAITSAWLAVQVSHDNNICDVNADEVYLAGLFHDIGKLYLLKSIDKLINVSILNVNDELIYDIVDELNIQLGIRVLKHWNIPEIYSNTLERLSTESWQCGTNDILVASVRLSCKIFQFIDLGIEVTDTSPEYKLIEDELLLLNIDDVAHMYNMIKAISC
ncbi:MAG: HDOD domain-containing protein [Pelobacteraceae bacterium]